MSSTVNSFVLPGMLCSAFGPNLAYYTLHLETEERKVSLLTLAYSLFMPESRPLMSNCKAIGILYDEMWRVSAKKDMLGYLKCKCAMAVAQQACECSNVLSRWLQTPSQNDTAP